MNINILALISLISIVASQQCPKPPTPSTFTLQKYSGLWYQIGKVQTTGGGFFERKCQCTRLDIVPYISVKNTYAVAENICREGGPGMETQIANGTLTPQAQPGVFQQSFFKFAPSVAYNVIYLDDDYSIEFDCGTSLGITNYCIHILARTPTIPDYEYNRLLNYALSLGLNLDNLPNQKTVQHDCGY